MQSADCTQVLAFCCLRMMLGPHGRVSTGMYVQSICAIAGEGQALWGLPRLPCPPLSREYPTRYEHTISIIRRINNHSITGISNESK